MTLRWMPPLIGARSLSYFMTEAWALQPKPGLGWDWNSNFIVQTWGSPASPSCSILLGNTGRNEVVQLKRLLWNKGELRVSHTPIPCRPHDLLGSQCQPHLPDHKTRLRASAKLSGFHWVKGGPVLQAGRNTAATSSLNLSILFFPGCQHRQFWAGWFYLTQDSAQLTN